LQIWQRSHALTLAVYGASGNFPRDELYGLTSQLRRSSASIAANIAEGCGRNTRREFARFLHIAMGSTSETADFLVLAHDLGYLSVVLYCELAGEIDQIQKMLRVYTGKIA